MYRHEQIIDLSHEINDSIPTWDSTESFRMKTTLDYGECGFRVQQMASPAGIGTHIDAPAHCVEGGRCVTDIPLTQLIAPAIVVNVSKLASETYSVSEQDLLVFEKIHRTIPQNSFVIISTGWSARWASSAAYRNEDEQGIMHFPTISPEAASLLLTRNVAGIGIDTLSVDPVRSQFEVHRMVLQANKYIVENIANADKLPAVGATTIILPLKIGQGTEAPVRMIGIIP